jgi:hypothetical protein
MIRKCCSVSSGEIDCRNIQGCYFYYVRNSHSPVSSSAILLKMDLETVQGSATLMLRVLEMDVVKEG